MSTACLTIESYFRSTLASCVSSLLCATCLLYPVQSASSHSRSRFVLAQTVRIPSRACSGSWFVRLHLVVPVPTTRNRRLTLPVKSFLAARQASLAPNQSWFQHFTTHARQKHAYTSIKTWRCVNTRRSIRKLKRMPRLRRAASRCKRSRCGRAIRILSTRNLISVLFF